MPVEQPASGAAAISALELGARLFLACAFGALVGIERQSTNPMLIAAGVVSGIGFIGGGVIMRRDPTVQGINTAATLWATASMG